MPIDLPAIIRSIPDFATKTPAECREYLATETTVLKTARQNGNDIMKLLGVVPANTLASALQSQGLILAVNQLATEYGIDFGDQVTQNMLDTLGQNQSFAPYVAGLKALGQDTRTRWARLTDDDLPDLAEFETAHSAALLVEQKTAASEALRQLLTAINDRINDGTLTAEQIAAIQLPE